MPGKTTHGRPLTIVAILITVVAVVGAVALGWTWGGDDPLPTALGAGAALLAVGWTLYTRFA